MTNGENATPNLAAPRARRAKFADQKKKGIIGIILPTLPGIPLLLIGLFILSSEYVWAHQLLGKIRKRFPATSRKVREWVGVSLQRGDRPPASLTTRNENRFLGARLSRRLRLCSSNGKRRRPLRKSRK